MTITKEHPVPNYVETLDTVFDRLCSELAVKNNPVDEEIIKNIIAENYMGGIQDEEQLYITSLEAILR